MIRNQAWYDIRESVKDSPICRCQGQVIKYRIERRARNSILIRLGEVSVNGGKVLDFGPVCICRLGIIDNIVLPISLYFLDLLDVPSFYTRRILRQDQSASLAQMPILPRQSFCCPF